MTEYTLDRTDDLPLSFEGELVAERSSEDGIRPRWTVLRLYRLSDDRGYVVESVGESAIIGRCLVVGCEMPMVASESRCPRCGNEGNDGEPEVSLRSATHCPTVSAVLARLRKSDASRGARRSYLPDLSWALLVAAHEAGALVLPEVEQV